MSKMTRVAYLLRGLSPAQKENFLNDLLLTNAFNPCADPAGNFDCCDSIVVPKTGDVIFIAANERFEKFDSRKQWEDLYDALLSREELCYLDIHRRDYRGRERLRGIVTPNLNLEGPALPI